MTAQLDTTFSPNVVLAVGAHADDMDVLAGGSLAAWAAAGAQVEYLVLTDGGKGSDDLTMTTERLVELRRAEQQAAAETLGVHRVHFLNYPDGELEVTQALKKDIVRVIRTVRPDTVVTMDPTMVYSAQFGMLNHPDHRAAGQATLDAIFPLARDRLTFPDLLTEEKLEPYKVAHVLLTHLDKHDCLIDISGTIDLKLAALKCHASQMLDNDTVGEKFRTRAAMLGRQVDVAYAEGFIRLNLPI